jgi:hypothetical protein
MSRQINIPYFSTPPDQYRREYLADITRAFALFAQQMNNPGPWRATGITLTDLQSGNDVGLEVGAVFEVDGFLKISRANVASVAGVSVTASVGSVTVLTP